MQFSLGDIARSLGADLEGDPRTLVTGVAGITDAGPGQITFFANPKYAAEVPRTRASAVIVPRDYSGGSAAALLRTDDPYVGFVQVLRMFSEGSRERPVGVHPTAVVDPSARLGERVSVGALCVVEAGAILGDGVILAPGVFVGRDSVLGDGSYLYPNVTVRENVILGKRVTVHSGSVLGSDGFGYARHNGGHEKIPQVGSVVIEDDVEIGANVAIDRATMGATRIGRGVKIDNLVHIAHNVVVGDNTLLVAQVGISGSTQVGKDVTLAGQAGIVGHITIGDRAMVGAQAGVTKSVPADTKVSGYPAMEHDRARRLNAYARKLPLLFEHLKALEKRVRDLERERDGLLDGKDAGVQPERRENIL
jgi:UDP-3-O-[3-hydroxymyristoyl] glucosamine N-acyltransferase